MYGIYTSLKKFLDPIPSIFISQNIGMQKWPTHRVFSHLCMQEALTPLSYSEQMYMTGPLIRLACGSPRVERSTGRNHKLGQRRVN